MTKILRYSARSLSFLLILVLFSAYNSAANGQAPPVPSSFQDLYRSLNAYLTTFNATLTASWPGTKYPVLYAGTLKMADSNNGPQLVNPASFNSIQMQLLELKAMGVQAVMLEVGFPMLYEPFLTSQGQSYTQFVSFYQQLAATIRGLGLKVIVENNCLLSDDMAAGWNTAPFYATLDWTRYQEARAQTALTVAQTLQPDYLVVVEEPRTEATQGGQSSANTPSGSVAMLTQILASVQQAGVPGMKVGAGVITSQSNALQFIQGYVALPVDFIDMHIYDINKSFLPNALAIASIAAAAGKPLSMSECWLHKVRDSEVGVLNSQQVRARNPFDFWAPLDALFLQTMENLANSTQMLFVAPTDSEMYTAYLPYDGSIQDLQPDQIVSQENAQAAANAAIAQYTSTGMSFYGSLVTPPDKIPPAVTGNLAGVSGNPTTAYLTWNASSDNVGVAGYYILRNGVNVATTAQASFQDFGLSETNTYGYAIQAFDLAGNLSAPSATIYVKTADATPPTTPANLTAVPVSCEKVKLNWSASADNNGVNAYLIFAGISPSALTQVGRVAGTNTSYTSYPLTESTTYYYGVEATDKSGNVSTMSPLVAITTPAAPGAPGGLGATPVSTTKVSLTWSAATSGGLPIQNYHVFRGTTATGLTQIAVTLNLSYNDNTATAATKYYYAVEAADTGGDLSALSAPKSVTTPAPPGAPGGLSASPVSTGKVSLAWSPAATGGLPIQNYHVFRGSSAGNLAQIAITTKTSYSDTSVSPATKYYYAVEAADTGGDLSAYSNVVLANSPGWPGAPTGLSGTPVSTTKISLAWSPAVSGGLPIQNYHVYRGSSASNLTQIAVTANTSYNDTTVSPSAKYYYAVQAADTGGDLSAYSSVVAANSPGLPGAPTGLSATPVSTTKITLAWSPASSGGLPVQNYHVYRGSSASSLTQIAVTANTTYNDTTVSPSAKYYYAVQAADTGGDLSAMSAVVSATALALPSAPTNVTAMAASKSEVDLSWAAAQSGLPLAVYPIYRGTSPSNLAPLVNLTASKLTYSDRGLAPGTTYYYGITARDTHSNTSPMSAVVAVTTPAQ